ncbi:MAG: trypsin-like peptidase domain-containing protein [Burkholderiaceae bacterium]
MADPEQLERLREFRQTMARDNAEGKPLFVPDLALLGLANGTRRAGVAAADGAARRYRRVLETICGVTDDSQEVEQYRGTLGVTVEFVAARQGAVAQVQWNDNLGETFDNPGNVSGVRWGSGTMIGDDLFLTCGHLFDDNANGWMLPRDNATGDVVTPAEKAANMHLNFNFQEDADGNLRPEQQFPITALVEYRINGLDFAVCRIGGNPGATFGRAAVSIEDAAVNDMICIIGHPAGMPKRIEAGPTTALNGDAIRYNDIDTLGGNSGSGILHANTGALVGVHTNGGCNNAGTGSNSGVRIEAILRESPTVRGIAHSGRWVARHGLDARQYQAASDELTGLGYRPLLVDAAGIGNQAHYAAIWEHRPGSAWVTRHGLTPEQYQGMFDELVPQGFRPVVVNGAGVGGQVRYAAIFENGPAPAWVARHGLTSQQYQAAFDQLVAQGFRPRFVDGTAVGDQILYSAVFEKRNGSPWVARHGLTARQYQGAFDELVGQGFRPVWVSGAAIGSDVFYAAVFDKRPGPAFVARHGLTAAQYQATFDTLLQQGFRATVVSTAGAGGQLSYAAIWEKR